MFASIQHFDVLQRAVEHAKTELKLVFLELNWEDSSSYVIKVGDLVECARFIHQVRSTGGSVLVHCAQVIVIMTTVKLMF